MFSQHSCYTFPGATVLMVCSPESTLGWTQWDTVVVMGSTVAVGTGTPRARINRVFHSSLGTSTNSPKRNSRRRTVSSTARAPSNVAKLTKNSWCERLIAEMRGYSWSERLIRRDTWTYVQVTVTLIQVLDLAGVVQDGALDTLYSRLTPSQPWTWLWGGGHCYDNAGHLLGTHVSRTLRSQSASRAWPEIAPRTPGPCW